VEILFVLKYEKPIWLIKTSYHLATLVVRTQMFKPDSHITYTVLDLEGTLNTAQSNPIKAKTLSSRTKTPKSKKLKVQLHRWLIKIITHVVEWCAAMKMMIDWSRCNWSPFNDSTINTQWRLVNKALCWLWPTNVRLLLLSLILWPKTTKTQVFKNKTLKNESRDRDQVLRTTTVHLAFSSSVWVTKITRYLGSKFWRLKVLWLKCLIYLH